MKVNKPECRTNRDSSMRGELGGAEDEDRMIKTQPRERVYGE